METKRETAVMEVEVIEQKGFGFFLHKMISSVDFRWDSDTSRDRVDLLTAASGVINTTLKIRMLPYRGGVTVVTVPDFYGSFLRTAMRQFKKSLSFQLAEPQSSPNDR